MKRLRELDVAGRTVLLRAEFNVVLDSQLNVVDDSRLRASLPTINWLCEEGARIVICSHLGRPWGKRDPSKSLKNIVEPLSSLLGRPIRFSEDCIGPERSEAQRLLGPSDIVLLENVRYYQEENDNDLAFAKALSEGVDIYINDAFGNSHRSHASMVGVPQFVSERASGHLVEKEILAITSFLDSTEHPAVALIGGAKVAGKDGKIHVIRNMLRTMDSVFVMGKIAYFFLMAQGKPVGGTIERDIRQIDSPDADLDTSLAECRGVLKQAQEASKNLLLPHDSVVTYPGEDETFIVDHSLDAMPDYSLAMDIGPHTRQVIGDLIAGARSVIWNGPAGYFEDERFQAGSLSVAESVVRSNAQGLVGGGDTIGIVTKVKTPSSNIHVSTGGGAMLTILMGRELPAITVLEY